jgi:3D (Asp-Asp-Asp) domain-containing protein
MRHSRKAVMKEHYKLYMRKHIFNGRYFVRNMEIAAGIVMVLALIVGAAFMGNSTDNTTAVDTQISLRDALFGSSDEETVTKSDLDEEATTEIATTEATPMVTETLAAVEVSSEMTEESADTEEATEEETEESEKETESLFSDRCIANVEETLNIRQQPDAESEFVGSMNPGAIAKVLGTEGDWTKIKSGDVEGYVLSDYVLTGEAAEEFSKDYVTLRGTVLEDGVNVRAEKSTDSDILQVVDKDDTLSVLEVPEEEEEQKEVTAKAAEEEADAEDTGSASTLGIADKVDAQVADEKTEEQSAEDITWLSVSLEDGRTGYVSADLVDVEELYELAVSAEELQRIAEAEAEAKRQAEEEAARQAMAAASQSASQTVASTGNSSSNSSSSDTSYQGATTTPVTATESGECIGTFTITAYCGCSKCSGGSNKTASGTTPTEGRTIAADTSILPYGTQVVIDGVVYTVEDCGSGVSGNHIDIFFATHEKAVAYGRKTVKVYKY